MMGSDLGMRISKFAEIKSKIFSFFSNPQSAFRIPQLYSLGQQWVLLGLAFVILGLLFFRFYVHPPFHPPEIRREFVVEVTGEVRKPGIYIFQNPSTLREAIEKAGGVKATGFSNDDSLSKTLETGTLLTISKATPVGAIHEFPLQVREIEQDTIKVKIGRMAANKLLVFSIPLDLNRVSMEDLCLVPGIGDSLAREIVAHRERIKGFQSVSELKNVKGIGEKKYQTLEKYFFVRP